METLTAMNNKNIIELLDKNYNPIGSADKTEVHSKGLLHRAFSVFVFNSEGEILLQQRASGKYHSSGLWTNTCCSHPAPGEDVKEAAHRRLMEEMGFDCRLHFLFNFEYKASFSNGLIEHEYDAVFRGIWNGNPEVNPAEVKAYKWIKPDVLIKDIRSFPEKYTEWLKIIYLKVFQINSAVRQDSERRA
jgi:isopentenyl-diphosphate delta-isomerase